MLAVRPILPIALALVALAGPVRADDLQVIGTSPDGSQIALIAVTADVPRGFHEQVLEIRSIPDGKIVSSTPLVTPAVRSRWARSGEFELYRLDVERARRVAIERVRGELGFAPPVSLPAGGSAVPWQHASMSDPRNPDDPPAVAVVRIDDAPVDAVIKTEGGSSSIVLRAGDREVALDPQPVVVLPVSGRPENVVYRWFGVREAWRDPAGRSLLLVVDTFVPVQRSFAARSVLVMAPLAPIRDALGLSVPAGVPVGGPAAADAPGVSAAAIPVTPLNVP